MLLYKQLILLFCLTESTFGSVLEGTLSAQSQMVALWNGATVQQVSGTNAVVFSRSQMIAACGTQFVDTLFSSSFTGVPGAVVARVHSITNPSTLGVNSLQQSMYLDVQAFVNVFNNDEILMYFQPTESGFYYYYQYILWDQLDVMVATYAYLADYFTTGSSVALGGTLVFDMEFVVSSTLTTTTGTVPLITDPLAPLVLQTSAPTLTNPSGQFQLFQSTVAGSFFSVQAIGQASDCYTVQSNFDTVQIAPNPDTTVGGYVFVEPNSQALLKAYEIWYGIMGVNQFCSSAYTLQLKFSLMYQDNCQVSTQGDPHLHLGHGGVADFRGINNTYFNMISFPGFSMAARTMDATFMLKHGIQVDGSFFDDAAWTLRSDAGEIFHLQSHAQEKVGFSLQKDDGKPAVSYGAWSNWHSNDLSLNVSMRQLTLVVTTREWQVNATRKPVYNFVTGPRWRFDFAVQLRVPEHNLPCFPHGILGQSYDGDGKAAYGKTDKYEGRHIVTKAMAEGAIEGEASKYILATPKETTFAYSRFDKKKTDLCKPRQLPDITYDAQIKSGVITTSEVA